MRIISSTTVLITATLMILLLATLIGCNKTYSIGDMVAYKTDKYSYDISEGSITARAGKYYRIREGERIRKIFILKGVTHEYMEHNYWWIKESDILGVIEKAKKEK